MCSVPRPRWLWVATGNAVEDALDLVVREAVLRQPLARAVGDELLGAGAGGHALAPTTPTMRRVPRSDATAAP